MARKPFNPDRIASPLLANPTPGSVAKTGDTAPWTVTQLAAHVKDAIAQGLPGKVRVVGEVSNLSDRSHWFFSLKDEGATIRCVCFASAVRKINFPVTDGMQVIATGRLDFYDQQGQLQLYVDKIEPVGQGTLELRFRALCEELRKLGYFDEARKKPLPAVPRRIAVITSRSAAALQDVINTASRRWGGCRLSLIDVRVQGAAAAPEIAAALNAVSRDGRRLSGGGIEAIILTRGGGSIEDLWAFNERIVADAIFGCTIPIVAAIGHETDTTVAELVADRRCSTPTQAAMTLIPDGIALGHQVSQLHERMTLLVKREFTQSRHRLETAARHGFFRRPAMMIQPLREKVDRLAARLEAAPRRVQADRQRVEALARQLAAVSPLNVLQRGYSYTLDPDGRVLRSVTAVSPGNRLTTVLSDGRVASDVAGAQKQTLAKTAKRSPRRIDKSGPTLFATLPMTNEPAGGSSPSSAADLPIGAKINPEEP